MRLQFRSRRSLCSLVLFAFLSFRQAQEQTPVNILRSLLGQLIRQSHRTSDRLTAWFESHTAGSAPTIKDLWSTFCSEVTGFDRIYVVCDALDEYVHGPEGFLDDFRNLFSLSVTNVFVTSRPTYANKAILGNFAKLEIPASESDIRNHVANRLEQRWGRERFLLKTSDRNEIIQTIVHHSNGRFLFAKLLLAIVESPVSLARVKQAVKSLGIQNIHSVYNLWMEDIISAAKDKASYALETFSWLAYARRPLTIEQLRHAIGMQIGSRDLNPADLPTIEALFDICSGLIVVDPGQQQVSLAHYSLNEFLQQHLPSVKHLLPGLNDPQALITRKCLTCLRFKPFSDTTPYEKADLGDRLERYAILGYAARYWGEHAQHVTLEYILDDVLELSQSTANTMSAGLIMSDYEQQPSHYEQAYRGMMGLHIFAYFGLTEIVENIVKVKKISPNVTTVGGWTALHWAARRGWTSTVSILLQCEASSSKTTKLDAWNALHLAAKGGHVDIVKSLLSSKVDVDAVDVQQRTALYLATLAGHAEVVQCLLEHHAGPNYRNIFGATALHCAAKKGYESIVRSLLHWNANVNAVDIVGQTALDEALKRRNDVIVSILISKGAESKRNTELQSGCNPIESLDWSHYKINVEDTDRVPEVHRNEHLNQRVCHVLERSTNAASSQALIRQRVFRKTYFLSKDTSGEVQKYFKSERAILDRLQHPNVVTYLDLDEDLERNAFFLYMEYCDLGDLHTRYKRPLDVGNDDDDDEDDYWFDPDSLSTEELRATAIDGRSVWILIAQLASALAYLHYGLAINYVAGNWNASLAKPWSQILHRDIKPANVVMQTSESNDCIFKLCDLGIASEAGKGPTYNTTKRIGTVSFIPPEVNDRGRPWTAKGDIWAFGETIRQTNKLRNGTFEDVTRELIARCKDKITQRPNSLEVMETAYNILDKNDIIDTLPSASRLQIQATHALLGSAEGGYVLRAFNVVADLLDDIVSLDDKEAKEHRTATLKRLETLWKDGAGAPFFEYPNAFSLHILVLLPLSDAVRIKHMKKLIGLQPNVNTQWERSRWTPLHLAAQAGNQQVVELLLAHKANKNRLDLHGRVPANYVDAANYPAILSILKPTAAEEKSSEHERQVATETMLSGASIEKMTLGGLGT